MFLKIQKPREALYDQNRRALINFNDRQEPSFLKSASSLVGTLGDVAVNAATNGGSSKSSKKEEGGDSGLGGLLDPSMLTNLFSSGIFKYGGQVEHRNVEVEGGETASLPNGSLLKFQGKSHEKGGIKLKMPVGSTIYSKRIMVDGKSIAQRQEERFKGEKKLEDKLKNNPHDMALRNSLKYMKLGNSIKHDEDTLIQDVTNTSQKKFMFGGGIGSAIGSAVGAIGDFTGIGKINSLNSELYRLSGKNENFYKNYGEEALQTLDKTEGLIDRNRAGQVMDNSRIFANQRRGNANRVRGVNALNALNLQSRVLENQQRRKINEGYTNRLADLTARRAQMQLGIDVQRSKGAQEADIANRKDLASYFAGRIAVAKMKMKATQNIGEDISQMGKNSQDRSILNSKYSNARIGNSGIYNAKSNTQLPSFNSMYSSGLSNTQIPFDGLSNIPLII